MNEESFNLYLSLNNQLKQVYLAIVSNHLTIHGRALGLDLTGEMQIVAFKGLNELQHQISQHIASIGLEAQRYPDTVLCEILLEKATQYGLSFHLGESLKFANSRPLWSDSKKSE